MTDISADELREIYQFAIQLGKDAGKILLDGLERRRTGEDEAEEMVEKVNAVDIVTKTDQEVETFISSSIAQKYPTHHFIGEESYSTQHSTPSNPKPYLLTPHPTWIVDPLDGTVNYTHASPLFCVSIALSINLKPVIGIIYAPLLNQLFTSLRGHGSFLNETTRLPLLGKQIGPLPKTAPRGCVFACEWGKDRRDNPNSNLSRKVESFLTMASEPSSRGGLGGMVHGVRSLGSATLDLAYTAMGSFDIWWEGGCWEWDVAAGICVLGEAGGLVTSANPPDGFEEAVAQDRWRDVEVEDAKLGGRLYLAIRPATDARDGSESGRQSQERVVREVWRRVRRLDYQRPGV